MDRATLQKPSFAIPLGVCTGIFIVLMYLPHHIRNRYGEDSYVLSVSASGSSKYRRSRTPVANSSIRKTTEVGVEAWHAKGMGHAIPWVTRGIVEDMLRYYEGDRKRCSVKHRKDGPSTERRNTPLCSREEFRKFVAARDTFPWEGTLWGNATDPHYQPGFCTLNKLSRFKDLGRRCTHGEKNNFKIVVYGDSNVDNLKGEIIRTLTTLGASCSKVRTEVFDDPQIRTRDVNYFATRDFPAEYLQGVRSIYRGAGDRAREYKCIHVSSSKRWTIALEYISSTRLVDTSISMGKTLDRTLMFSSFNEYLFRHYYKDKGYPDALFIWVPFHHMKWFTSLRKTALDVRYLDQLARVYLPITTQIYWIPDTRECHNPEWIAPNGMGTNQMLYVMNRVLYETLRPRFLDASSKVYPFLDLGRIVCDVTCAWHKDAAHMINGVYSILSRILLQLACG